MSFDFKRINPKIIDDLRIICERPTDQWTKDESLKVSMIIGAINMAREYRKPEVSDEKLADVKFQRDQLEKAAKEWMEAFDAIKRKYEPSHGGLVK